jgi:rod shape-determining protein MreC
VLGQVTRVYPLVSEVTLMTDRDQAIPVLNTRTGARGVAFGDSGPCGPMLELRFMAANADVQAGDLLTTSGVDGVYPPGLPVARVEKVERRADRRLPASTACRWPWWTGAPCVVLQPVAHKPARPAPGWHRPRRKRSAVKNHGKSRGPLP